MLECSAEGTAGRPAGWLGGGGGRDRGTARSGLLGRYKHQHDVGHTQTILANTGGVGLSASTSPEVPNVDANTQSTIYERNRKKEFHSAQLRTTAQECRLYQERQPSGEAWFSAELYILSE